MLVLLKHQLRRRESKWSESNCILDEPACQSSSFQLSSPVESNQVRSLNSQHRINHGSVLLQKRRKPKPNSINQFGRLCRERQRGRLLLVLFSVGHMPAERLLQHQHDILYGALHRSDVTGRSMPARM